MRIRTPATLASWDVWKGLITWHTQKCFENHEGLAVDVSVSLTVEWDRQLSPEETVHFLQLWIKGLFPVKRGKEASYGLKKQIRSKWQTLVLPTSKIISIHFYFKLKKENFMTSYTWGIVPNDAIGKKTNVISATKQLWWGESEKEYKKHIRMRQRED